MIPLAQKAPFVYDSEYYTSTQAAIYIGDVWVDEVTGIQYEVAQVKTPVFGYGSQFYDAVSRGPVIVRGSFTVNFKEAGYLFLVLARNAGVSGMKKGGEHPYNKEGKDQINRWNVERALELDPSSPEAQEFYNDMAGFASEAQAKGGKGIDKFENLAENFENVIYGGGSKVFGGDGNLGTAMKAARRADDHRLGGFDIFVQFGDYTNDLANHTMRRIVDCHIISTGQVVGGDSNPIQESYEFIAKTIL